MAAKTLMRIALVPLAALTLLACEDPPPDGPTQSLVEETPTGGSLDPTPTLTAAEGTPTAVAGTPTASGQTPTAGGGTPTQGGATPTAGADTPTQGGATPTAGGATPTAPGGTMTDPQPTPTEGGTAPPITSTEDTDAPGTPTEPPATPTRFSTPTAPPPTPTAIPDRDGDGYAADADCDDGDPAVNPGAAEVCNGHDDDCDGATDDADDSLQDPPAWYADNDDDGYGDGDPTLACVAPPDTAGRAGDCDDSDPAYHPGAPEEDCTDPADYNCDGQTGYADSDGDGAAACEDCNDADASIHPGATEVCDEEDQDCDTTADEGVTTTFYEDNDGDGHGTEASTADACQVPDGYAATADDCDDSNSSISPEGEEQCDGDDNDCDTAVDEGVQQTFYADADDDGFGDPDSTADACDTPDGYVRDDQDCDDTYDGTHPGAAEVADGDDNDCDTTVDEGTEAYDDDGDGTSEDEGDCDDTNPDIHPGAAEAENGVDDDCDTTVDEGTNAYDDDGDGFSENEGDCDDTNASVFPGQVGCGYDFGAENCSEILYAGNSVGDGYYLIDPDGDGPREGFTAYCDMSTDGGGWTLMGTIAGGDLDHWNSDLGYWADERTLGSLSDPFDADFKSPAWFESDTVAAEVLWERAFDGDVRGRAVLHKDCLGGARSFSDRFSEVDQSLACLPGQIRVLEGSAVGVSSNAYAEGESSGLGGSGTNGFCWFGEDTDSNVFRGHLHWTQYPGEETCKAIGHLGGVGVYWNNSSQYQNKDITGTNWLYNTDYALTRISLYVRTPHPSDRDDDGYTTAAGDCDDRDPRVYPGSSQCAYQVGGESCSDILYAGNSKGDGVYLLEPAGADPYEVYCDMTTDGGGWTLMGTLNGGDADRWNTELGHWASTSSFGSLFEPFDADYKSPAWSGMDSQFSEVLVQRRHDGVVRGRSILGRTCMGYAPTFKDLFTSVDTSLACGVSDIRTITASPIGVSSAAYAEGVDSGLGGPNTNGFCWFIEDTDSNVFRGHLGWTQYPGEQTCKAIGHLGGVAVYWNNSGQYQNKDITTTNWLYETETSKTDLSLFVRIPRDSDRDADGFSTAGGDCDDRDPAVYPGTAGCGWDVGGTRCDDIISAGDSLGDGVYLIRPNGEDPYEVYCDMTTDGGGWTLLGTLSGGDLDHWNVEFGPWQDTSAVGDLLHPLDADYKSPAWNRLDLSGSEVLFTRSFKGVVRGQTVLTTPCLKGATHFSDLFATRDDSLACGIGDLVVLKSSATGVSSTSYAEGASSGLGGGGTNGFCWYIEDTDSNVFRGHLGWTQYPGSNTCKAIGHLGGVAVYWNNSGQYQNKDITTTNWLYETEVTETDISLFGR